MKKLKINKMALSVATAFLMLTSIVSTVASASGGNEIKLTSDKNFAQAVCLQRLFFRLQQ